MGDYSTQDLITNFSALDSVVVAATNSIRGMQEAADDYNDRQAREKARKTLLEAREGTGLDASTTNSTYYSILTGENGWESISFKDERNVTVPAAIRYLDQVFGTKIGDVGGWTLEQGQKNRAIAINQADEQLSGAYSAGLALETYGKEYTGGQDQMVDLFLNDPDIRQQMVKQA